MFALTELGEPLRSRRARIGRGLGRLHRPPQPPHSWGALAESVRTGENAFLLAHGVKVWEYRAEHPEEGTIFDRAMAASSNVVLRSLLAAYDFGRFGTIVDVGGGNGALLAGLLEANPALQGVLFDQPHVVEGVDLGERGSVVAGNFFESVPDGGDAYLLKWIIHDWEDEESIAILRNVRSRGGTLLLVERILGPPNETPEAKLSDLNMLVGPGGQERTRDEFESLLEAAGYELVGTTPTESGMFVIEGTPAG